MLDKKLFKDSSTILVIFLSVFFIPDRFVNHRNKQAKTILWYKLVNNGPSRLFHGSVSHYCLSQYRQAYQASYLFLQVTSRPQLGRFVFGLFITHVT